jgi:starch-binding outer membrane protein, SusD/RagB family
MKKNKTMKIKLIYSIFLSVLISSCNFLDVDPLDAVPAEDVFTDKKGLDGALTGSYNTLYSASLSQDAILFADLLADNLIHVGTKQEYRQISDNIIFPDNGYTAGLWNRSYDGINRVNNIIAQIDNVEGVSDSEKENYLAQCYFLRAHFYANLVKHFGDVPLREDPINSAKPEDLNIARTSAGQIYDFILTDLEEAERLLEGTGKGNPSFANEGAVKAFLARTYLFLEDWQKAADKAAEVIDMPYELETEFADIFDETSMSNEIIFAINFYDDQSSFNATAEWVSPESRFEVAAWETTEKTSSVYNYFSENDARRDATVQYSELKSAYYCAKYRTYGSDKDNMIIFRLAEMYLIAAEALNELNYEADGEAFDMLNEVRTRAGLADLTSAEAGDQNAFRLALEEERRLEYAFEGHRFFDLKRTNRINDVLPDIGTLKSANWLFPIPQSELDTNEHEGMTQNEGYY